MSFSQKATLPVTRRRHQRKRKPGARVKKVKYQFSWVYPTVLVAMVVLLVTMYLCQSAQQIRIQYDIGQLRAQKEDMLTRQREILLSIESLESLERIEKIAREEMNMIHPSQRVVLNLHQPASTAFSQDIHLASIGR